MEQFFEHSDLELGAMTFQKGPGAIHCWTGRIADTEILFSIILNTSELRSANLNFIRSVLQNWQEYLRSQIPWKSLSSQRMDLGAELLNFWCGEDELDWGYSQYFEIAAGNLKPFLAMTLFTEILCKHFPDVMSAPVKRLSSKL